MRPSQTILVLEDLVTHVKGPLSRDGVELSSNDTATTLDVYQQWLLLMVDLGYLHHETFKRDATRLLTDMVQKDVLCLNNAFAELLHYVRVQNSRGFKALCRNISCHLFNLIKEDFNKMLSSDVFAAKRLIQLFSYTSRLTLREIDLTQQCLDSYMEVETNMSNYLPSNLLDCLNKILRRWLGSFDPDRLHPSHGPGGVAGHGRTSLEVKYRDLTYDTVLFNVFGTPRWVCSPIHSSCDRISQTIFVPKSYKTFRTISMEPTTLQYWQQAVWKEIDRVVQSDSYLRNRIGFHDQTRNQMLAREGSIDRNYATIDLSAASDSVSYKLVKRLFRGTKAFKYIIATRSRRTLLPDGRLIFLKKFAPMGSALCFPIETLIFASICQFVTREHGITGDYSVFGDDIIVPTQCVDDVICTLELLGFSVNRDKSFYDSQCWFRESCGAEYCDGYDVTPMRVSRNYNHDDDSIHVESVVSLANNAYKYGFRNLRSFFLKKFRDSGHIALFSPTGVLADNYTNYHTERRWNPDLQRLECRVHTYAPKRRFRTIRRTVRYYEVTEKRPILGCDEIRYRHWLESTANRTTIGDGFEADVTRVTVVKKNQWMEKPYEWSDQPLIDFFTTEE